MGNNEPSWQWPDELDALIAAPANLGLDHPDALVLEQDLMPRRGRQCGAGHPMHTHRWASVEYVLSTTDFIRRIANARPELSAVLWSPPLPPHSLENVGDRELRVIMAELKDSR